MKIDKIFSFLTYPGKNKDNQPDIESASLPLKGKLFNMLSHIFDNAEKDCGIPVMFVSEEQDQENTIRDAIVRLSQSKSIKDGRLLAERLQLFTTKKSGMGLLFISIGTEGYNKKIVISRFPAEEGIVAEKLSGCLLYTSPSPRDA